MSRPTMPIVKRSRAEHRNQAAATRARIDAIEQRLPAGTKDEQPLFHLGFASTQARYAEPYQRNWGEVPR